MQPEITDANNGAAAEPKQAAGTPRQELARMRAPAGRRSPEVREQIMAALLEACGELGYHKVPVRAILERYGGHRVQFYSEFANKAECYEAAYGAEAERLVAALLGAAAVEPDWRAGLAAALRELARYAAERPLVARGILIEVHVAGGPALAKRKELFERLTRAIDSARRETGSRHSPPPMTALFMVSAIEAAVCAALEAGELERFAAATGELAGMVAAAYFGEERAGAEMAG
jgi:AcrR family transcriptional regulator